MGLKIWITFWENDFVMNILCTYYMMCSYDRTSCYMACDLCVWPTVADWRKQSNEIFIIMLSVQRCVTLRPRACARLTSRKPWRITSIWKHSCIWKNFPLDKWMHRRDGDCPAERGSHRNSMLIIVIYVILCVCDVCDGHHCARIYICQIPNLLLSRFVMNQSQHFDKHFKST